MYSGTTFRAKSGRIMGVHQRIDRLARKGIKSITNDENFPAIKDILHFEGLNGPDGVKRKSPSKDEPWHYIDPDDPNDTAILDMVRDHVVNLAQALADNNNERASFEAAWMAHAIADGMTPAHHYPLEAKLEHLRGGEGIETRTSIKDKTVMPGNSIKEMLKNNWEYWGARGIMTTHIAFEIGVATTISPYRFDLILPKTEDILRIEKGADIGAVFLEFIKVVDKLDMYKIFQRAGWSRGLALQTREILIPEIVRCVELGWLAAICKSKTL